MSRIIKPTPLEYYVRNYLKHHQPYTIGKVYLQKALAMVQWKANSPCCDDPNASVDLHTPTDNNFSNMVRMLLKSTVKFGNTKSLARTVSLLKNALQGQCCGDGSLDTPTLTATASAYNKVTLSWTGNLLADSYTLEQDTASDFSSATAIYTGSNTTYSKTGLTASTHYYYRVKATAAEYDDSDYGTDDVTTPAQPVTGDPASLTATANGTDTVDLTWTAPASGGADSYVLQKDTASDYSTATDLYTGSDLTYSDTGLDAGTEYYYRVKAVKSGQVDSGWVTANATTDAA